MDMFNDSDSLLNSSKGRIVSEEFLQTSTYIIVLMCGTVVFGVSGNAVLIAMVLRRHSLRTSPTYVLLTSMALSDVVLLLSAPSFDIVYALQQTTPLGTACYIRLFCVLFSVATTLYHLMSFSVLRYIILIHPLFSMAHISSRNVSLLAAAIWVASFSGAGTTMTISGNYAINTSDGKTLLFCALNPNDEVQYFFVLVASGIPFIVMIGFHIAKVIKLKAQPFSQNGASSNRKNVSTKVVMSLIITFCLCGMPTVIYSVVLYFFDGPLPSYVYQLMPIAMSLMYANSALNPLMYYFLSKRKTLRCC